MIEEYVQRLWLSYVWLVSPSIKSWFSSIFFDPIGTNIGNPGDIEFHPYPYLLKLRRLTIGVSSKMFSMVEVTKDSNTDDDEEGANNIEIHKCD